MFLKQHLNPKCFNNMLIASYVLKKKKWNICCKWIFFLTKKWGFSIVGCDTLGERFSKFVENNLCS